jgi:hypothetical protein
MEASGLVLSEVIQSILALIIEQPGVTLNYEIHKFTHPRFHRRTASPGYPGLIHD